MRARAKTALRRSGLPRRGGLPAHRAANYPRSPCRLRRPRRGVEMKKRKRRLARTMAAGGTVTLATLGLTTCDNNGGGVVDPPPPPPLECKDANRGQNISAYGAVSGD